MKQLFAVLLVCLFATSSAQAEAQWSFRITNPTVFIEPTDTVSLIGEISNSANSTDILSISEPCTLCVIPASLLVGYSHSTVFNFDDGAIGSEPLYKTLAGINITSGESFSFIAYTLSPIAGAVPLGNYQFFVNSLYLTGYGSSDAGIVNVAIVPEPSNLVLMLSGFVFLGTSFFLRNRSACAQPIHQAGLAKAYFDDTIFNNEG